MLNEQKIKKMRKLATYESGKGRKQLRISIIEVIISGFP